MVDWPAFLFLHVVQHKISVRFTSPAFNFRVTNIEERIRDLPRYVNYATVVINAYVNLPADSAGWMGWVRPCRRQSLVAQEPISLRVRYGTKRFNASQLSSKMVLELQLRLFGFADAAYGITSNKEHRIGMSMRFIKTRGFQLERILVNKDGDTLAIIFSTAESIVIAFKGTSVANLRADLKVQLINIGETLPGAQRRVAAWNARDGFVIRRWCS